MCLLTFSRNGKTYTLSTSETGSVLYVSTLDMLKLYLYTGLQFLEDSSDFVKHK